MTPWTVPAGLLCPLNSPGKNTRVGCHFLLQDNLPNPEIKPGSPTLQAESLQSEPPGEPNTYYIHINYIHCDVHQRWGSLVWTTLSWAPFPVAEDFELMAFNPWGPSPLLRGQWSVGTSVLVASDHTGICKLCVSPGTYMSKAYSPINRVTWQVVQWYSLFILTTKPASL